MSAIIKGDIGGTFPYEVRPDCTFEFAPGRPLSYWLIAYHPPGASKAVGCLLERDGLGIPSKAEIVNRIRDDFSGRRGLAT